MDYSMPGEDGPTTCQRIRNMLQESNIARERQPFIAMLTAYQETRFHKRAKDKGFDVSLVKPIFKDNMHKLLIKSGILS